jgi:hypothetical protein
MGEWQITFYDRICLPSYLLFTIFCIHTAHICTQRHIGVSTSDGQFPRGRTVISGKNWRNIGGGGEGEGRGRGGGGGRGRGEGNMMRGKGGRGDTQKEKGEHYIGKQKEENIATGLKCRRRIISFGKRKNVKNERI